MCPKIPNTLSALVFQTGIALLLDEDGTEMSLHLEEVISSGSRRQRKEEGVNTTGASRGRHQSPVQSKINMKRSTLLFCFSLYFVS